MYLQRCTGCQNLTEGPSYTEYMEQGTAVFEESTSGSICSQTVYCTSKGTTCSDLVSITVTQIDGTTSEAANGACGQNISITLECGGNDQWFFPDLPTYPLNAIIICEGTLKI